MYTYTYISLSLYLSLSLYIYIYVYIYIYIYIHMYIADRRDPVQLRQDHWFAVRPHGDAVALQDSELHK